MKTPIEAEAWAKEHGRSEFASLLEAHSWDFEKRLWPFALAVIWIAYRNTECAIQAWGNFCFWRGHIYRDANREGQQLSLPRAEFELLLELERGKFRAEARRRGRQSQPIDSSQWHSARWIDDATSEGMVLKDGEEYYEILVPKNDVLTIWPHLSPTAPGRSTTRVANVNQEKLFQFLDSLSGRKTEEEYMNLSLAHFPSKNVPREILREQIKRLPEDRRVARGRGTQKQLP
jgi:hypothetical protein